MNKHYFEWEKIHSIPISALQHYVYCPRQFALIHIEEIYEENIFTLQGNFVHERVDNEKNYYNKQKKCENSLPIWSDIHGLYGVVDIVEFNDGIPYPVEFKRGKKKNKLADDIQLTGEVICLEEMFDIKIEKGAIYYYSSRRKREVIVTEKLKHKLVNTIKAVRSLLMSQKVPSPVNDQRCKNCSLIDVCIPNLKEKIKLLEDNMFNKEKQHGS